MSLNPNQGRAVSVALRLLEERLARIENIVDRDESGALYRRTRPKWDAEERARFDAVLAELRAAIAALTEEFDLIREERNATAEIAGLTRVSWENITGIQSRRLRAYGRVDPGLRTTLDPAVEHVLALISALEEITHR